jgi:hypothetical protein
MGLNSNTMILIPVLVFSLEFLAITVITIQATSTFASTYFPLSNQTLPPAPQYSNSFLGSFSTFAGAFYYAFQLLALMIGLLAQIVSVLTNQILLNPILLFINAIMLFILALGIIGKIPLESGE